MSRTSEMPSDAIDGGLWFDDDERIGPGEESRKSNKPAVCRGLRSPWFCPTFLEQSKLFSEEEVLSNKGCSRDEEKSDNRQQL